MYEVKTAISEGSNGYPKSCLGANKTQQNSVSPVNPSFVVVVCRLHYINTLKQELNGTKAYEETSKDEKSVVYSHLNEIPK